MSLPGCLQFRIWCCCRCPNLAVQEADDSEGEEEEDVLRPLDKNGIQSQKMPQAPKVECDTKSVEVQWIGDPVYSHNNVKYYRYGVPL